MPNKDDIDWFKQTLRATFPYLVFIVVFIFGTFLIILWASSEPSVGFEESAILLERAHSHNDYTREHPLRDALQLGFGSVEADIFLVDGELLVAHDRDKVSPDRTLTAMYLEPLWARFQRYGHVYEKPMPFTLLIDIKSEGVSTFAALHDALQPFASMLTHFDAAPVKPGAVSVIISGDRAFDAILAAKPRLSGVDGRLNDLDGAYTAAEMPLISDNWFKHFKWAGKEEIPEAERLKLKDIVTQAHGKNMRVRFWAIPHREALWEVLHDAGVDLLNADDLPRLQRFLASQSEQPK